MAEIIPVIFEKNFKELEAKLKLIEPYVKTVQLDIADGLFVDNKTFWQPEDLAKLEAKVFLEAHLMVKEPGLTLDRWLASPVGRIILHWEAIEQNVGQKPKDKTSHSFLVADLAEKIHKHGKELGVALNPEMSIEVLDNFIQEIDLVLLMSVRPGFSGQKFETGVIPKIKQLRQKYPNVKIEVDGGIKLDNCRQLIEAGADLLVVGSSIFSGDDIERQIKLFKEAVK